MENLHRLKSDALVDILSTQTAAYLQMQSEGGSEDNFRRCKLLLKAVQKELDDRNKKEAGNLVPDDQTLKE